MQQVEIETGTYYYMAALGNPLNFRKVQLHCFYKYTYKGYTFYLNLSKNEDTKEYGVTEEATGYQVMRCMTNDPYIIKHRLRETLEKNWDKFVKDHTIVQYHSNPNLILNMLMSCGSSINI